MFRRISWWALVLLLTLIYPPRGQSGEPASGGFDRHVARKAIKDALGKQVDWKFKETPLCEVAETLRKELKISMHLDQRSLEDLGVTPDSPVNFEISGVTARSALELLLRDLGLTNMIHGEALIITSADEADANLITQTYDVADLMLLEGRDGSDFDSLIDMITKTIKPTTWDEVGGPGSAQPFESVGIHALVISQTDEVHDQVAELFADLRALRTSKTKPQAVTPTVPGAPAAKSSSPSLSVAQTAARAAEEIIRKALKRPISADFKEKNLFEVVAFLEKETGQKFHLDKKAICTEEDQENTEKLPKKEFTAEEIERKISDIKISAHFQGISLEYALDQMLEEVSLSWAVKNETICITSMTAADMSLFTRIYDVSDMPAFRTKEGVATPDYDSLIESIEGAICPTTWDQVGGPASIAPLGEEGRQTLVVYQTWQIHEAIVELLDELRGLRKAPLTKDDLEKLPPPRVRKPRKMEIGGIGNGQAPPVKMFAPLESDALRDSVVTSSNRVAVDLYAKLCGKTKENVIYSPYSLATVLAMAHAGARGDTAGEIAKTLHLSLDQEEVPAGYAALFKAIALGSESANRLLVANRLWCQHDFKYRDAFLKTCSESFRSELGLVDFKNPESARQEINAWVTEKTQRKIENLFDKDSIQSDWRLAITNAVNFKDEWETKFVKSDTRPDLFQAENGTVRVQMMHQERSCSYAELEGVQILEKSYRAGHMSMVFVLPQNQENALSRLEASLSEETLREWFSKLETKTVSVYLPRFRLDAEYDLASTLQSLGMKKAFSRNDADLSGMLEQPGWKLWIDSIVQKAFIAVDEAGTEAAAASGMGMGGMGGFGPAPEIPIFRADHPFLFMIRDTRTGCILFMGRVMDPPVEKSVPEKQGGMGMF